MRTTVALALTGTTASLSIAHASRNSCYFVDVYSGAESEVPNGHSFTSPTGKTCTCDFGRFGSCTQLPHQNPCQPLPKTEGECRRADPHCYWAPASEAHPVASCIHEYDFGFRSGRIPAVDPPLPDFCPQLLCSPDSELVTVGHNGRCPEYDCRPIACPQPHCSHGTELITVGHNGRCPEYDCQVIACPQPHCSHGTELITVGHNGRCPEYECGLPEFDVSSGHACRGDFPSDNSDRYYDVTWAHSLAACQATCKESHCFGVEFNHANGKCELWKRPIGHTKSMSGFTCSPMKPVPVPSVILP